MIFVILGTQDKQFPRILKSLEKEIKNKNIKEHVIVQAGCTKYKSKYMEIYDYLDMKSFNNYINDADYIITHGGVGSILDSIKKNKKVLVVPREQKYDEHENDHQIQITERFAKMGYILPCMNTKYISLKIQELKEFKPKKFVSNNKKLINKIEEYIDNL